MIVCFITARLRRVVKRFKMANTIEASYEHHCTLCDCTIEVGDQILEYDGEWCHEDCVEEEQATALGGR